MPKTQNIESTATPYASNGDFCRIFCEETDSLYGLSFLLTADREKAQQAVVCGLEDSVAGNPVFKEWAHSWARRAIIQNAVRLINPRFVAADPLSGFNGGDETPTFHPAGMAAVLNLAPFERFVFVMSILEQYSDHECSILLDCSRREVIAARSRALQQIGGANGFHLERDVDAPSSTPNYPSLLEDVLHV